TIDETVSAENLYGVVDIRFEVNRAPGPRDILRDQAADLGHDIRERRQFRHLRRPRFELPLVDVRLQQVVEHDPDVRALANDLDRTISLRRAFDEQVEREAILRQDLDTADEVRLEPESRIRFALQDASDALDD